MSKESFPSFEGPRNRPNWVSSRTNSESHVMQPIPFKGNAQAAVKRIKDIALAMSGATLVDDQGLKLHFEFKSFLFGFIDDVYIEVSEEKHFIDFYSRSRVGYGDLGANRKRMTNISEAFKK